MKKRMLVGVAALTLAGAALLEAREVRFWVFGSGTAQDSNRSSAVSAAADSAEEQINAECAGSVEHVERTGTTCFGGDGDTPFTCLVFAKGMCELRGR
jgi:hypothetical protein